ncbi:hypothetical protein EGW08_016208 [Elysia chlorotica]|uniref:Uncharacterized protein n=1 Tax=Elysia chlorotica TaxID=188477 RepID=A0A3S1HBL5_ELYCH|nr:hypothetical protein EGW08_016208 [Elysia chlorotica]
MERSQAGDSSSRNTPVMCLDFECQVGGRGVLVGADMASHPLLPELTGTRDKQCQAFALTSDVQCQVMKTTLEAQCQARSGVDDNTHASGRTSGQQEQKLRTSTTCSASQCRLPSPSRQVAHVHSQTDRRGAPLSAASLDVSSQTDLAQASSHATAPRDESAPATAVTACSHAQSQTDITSTPKPNTAVPMDTTAVQAVTCSSDATNQTETINTRSQNASTMTTRRCAAQNALQGDHNVQSSSSRDFQCQTWPDSRDVESQAGARDIRESS